MSSEATGDASSEPYQYEHLNSNTGEIRLIKITNVQEHPDKDTIVLELDIQHTRLDETDDYVAISYAWGNPARTHKLLVNGAALFVPENTFRTLYTVYHTLPKLQEELGVPSSPAPLWIDAVCLNQSDLKEKDEQVRRMGQIYSQATATLGYIGRPPQGKSPFDGFRTLLWMGNDSCFTINDVPTDATHAWFRESTRDFGRFEQEVGPIKEFAEAFAHLFSMDWFVRGWVVQEMVLSKHAFCLYGYGANVAAMNLNILMTLNDHAFRQYRYAYFIVDALQTMNFEASVEFAKRGIQLEAWFRIRINRDMGDSEPHGLLELLRLTRLGKVTDPRDRIYSLMGIMKEQDRAAIRVDYSDDYTAADLFLDVAVHCLGSPDGQRVLGWAGLGHNRVISQLPSWVPDWSAQSLKDPVMHEMFSASGNLSHPLTLLDGGRRISARGVYVDTITFLDPRMAYADSEESDPTNSGARWILHYAAELCLNLQRDQIGSGSHAADTYRFNNEPWHDVIRRTCCMDQRIGGMHAGPDDRPAFEACLEQFGFGADALATVMLDEGLGMEVHLDETRGLAAGDFTRAVEVVQNEMVLGTTGENGFIGSFGGVTREGDIVAVILGMKMPVVLRPLGDAEGGFLLVGPCYVHGIMDGEWITHVIDGKDEGSEGFQDFVIH